MCMCLAVGGGGGGGGEEGREGGCVEVFICWRGRSSMTCRHGQASWRRPEEWSEQCRPGSICA